MRRIRLLVPLLVLAFAVPAAAQAKAWHSYGLFRDRVEVEGGSGTHSARLTQMLLPDTFKVKRRAGGYLAFGPTGACRSTGSVRVGLVSSSATAAADVRDELLPAGTSYGTGPRGDAAWGIVNSGGGALRGAYVRPTRFDETWIVVRVATTPHANCHTGGYRESVAFPLADALATTKASGY